MAQAIIKAAENGKTVVGICGGYQMMGTMISDPEGIEGSISGMPGLGLLPMHTVMNREKTTKQVRFGLNGSDSCDMEGYEIHNGRTEADSGSSISRFAHGRTARTTDASQAKGAWELISTAYWTTADLLTFC
mgnify:CR=1 FL=1